ncbi:MAG: hypothetical protein LBF16_06605 [Pseudomonadales bacterium]|jgi:hypothetical protein|nr:hypothetical protein [Pseudomonadales bacterium]
MRIFIVLLFAMLAASATADERRIAVDFYCLSEVIDDLSGEINDGIHLVYRTFIDTPIPWITAYVKYQNSPEPIALVLKSELDEEIAESRPWQSTYTWLESVDGEFTGEYEVMSQGAIIYNFVYKNYRNGQVTYFFSDLPAYDVEQGQCTWE